jgi:hypothetical protein
VVALWGRHKASLYTATSNIKEPLLVAPKRASDLGSIPICSKMTTSQAIGLHLKPRPLVTERLPRKQAYYTHNHAFRDDWVYLVQNV